MESHFTKFNAHQSCYTIYTYCRSGIFRLKIFSSIIFSDKNILCALVNTIIITYIRVCDENLTTRKFNKRNILLAKISDLQYMVDLFNNFSLSLSPSLPLSPFLPPSLSPSLLSLSLPLSLSPSLSISLSLSPSQWQ